IEAIEKLRAEIGKPKMTFTPPEVNAELKEAVHKEALALGLKDAFAIKEKLLRYGKRSEIQKEVKNRLKERFPEQEKAMGEIFHDLEYVVMRALVTDDKKRLDGRGFTDIRPIDIEV